ncbi:MAG TPA: hypothetical protein VN851_15455 [Thermoanaerobaculia bacterium]|nr:hypothetical protein [Thermoanaerobaculia bacterium]
MRRTFWVVVLSLLFVVCGATSLSAICNSNQTCQAPPFGIYCSGSASCNVGPDWVECDGNKTYCPPVAPCTGTCFSSLQCYAICGEGGVEPSIFRCDVSTHCCRCYY